MAKRENELIDKILSLSDDVRYVAVYRDNQLESKSKEGTHDASGSETDLYEELLVNPTLLKLASQRGNIDCGGLDYLIVKYGHFFQFILPVSWGHVSVCIDKDADPISIGSQVTALIEGHEGKNLNSMKINLHQHEDRHPPIASNALPGSADLCFITQMPLPDVIAHVQSCRVEIILIPVEKVGARGPILSIYFRDPDGNLVEVSNYRV